VVVVIKWLAHASFQISCNGKVVYVDLEEYGKPVDKADLVLVTHSHTDHCDPTKIRQVRKNSTVVIAPADCVSKIGGNVKTLKPGEETTVDGIKVRAVEAYNYKRFRSPGNPYHPKGFGVGYLITVEGKIVYHAGDTDFIPEMRQFGNIDVALLPSGGTYTMDNEGAASAAIAINPKVVIPMHRWDTNAEELKKRVETNSKIRVLLLKEGEEYQIS
jgi:L-ascorbate metabolism protein UlaG (beta-lactamase superfamily)